MRSRPVRTRHPEVSGVDLLALRNAGDVPAMIAAVCKATAKPVIVAGFTVGTSALNGRFPAKSPALSQV